MRVPMRFLMAAALVVPVGLVAAGSTGANAAGGTTCSKTSGTATFKPALPPVSSSQTVTPKVIVKNGKSSGCTGGGVTSSTFTSLAKFHTATNCQILLNGSPNPNPPTGTITTTWNTGATSTGNVTLGQVSGQPTQTHITGTVTAGLFKGLHIDQTLAFTPKKGNCTSTALSQVTFTAQTPLKIS